MVAQAVAVAKEASAAAKDATAAVKRLSQQVAKVDENRVSANADRAMVAVERLSEQVAKVDENDKVTRKRIEEAEEARGRNAETWFRESLPKALEKAGYKVDSVEPRRLKGQFCDYDFVAVNGDAVFVGEVKVRFRAKHVSQLKDLADSFRKDFPDKAGGRKVFGIACGMTVDEDAGDRARTEGFLVAQATGKSKVLAKPRKARGF